MVEFNGIQFFILESPTKRTAAATAKELQRRDVHTLVQTCERIYDTEVFEDAGISVLDFSFPTGTDPNKLIIDRWVGLVKNRRQDKVAVHCLSGLGRSAVLVGIALISMGLDAQTAIKMIRRDQAKALNQPQVNYLINFRPKIKQPQHDPCCVLF